MKKQAPMIKVSLFTHNQNQGALIMNTHSSLFSQILSIVSKDDFYRIVAKHKAQKHAKGFSCWDQFVAMMFCQLAQAKSLNEIVIGLAMCEGKLNHLGMTASPAKSTLSYANANRSWMVYRDLFQEVLYKCYSQVPGGKKKFRFKNKLQSMDSTTIDLCLKLFPWAKFRQTKGAVKLHVLLDHDGYFPSFAHITDGKVHDVRVARQVELAPGSIIVFDRAYTDFGLFQYWNEQGVYFVTRAKSNIQYRILERREKREGSGVSADWEIEMTGFYTKQDCPAYLRLIKYKDEETGKELEFLTNNMDFVATTIAQIYKDRWQIECFFKTLKQNLKIKTFVGTSQNALYIQIWTALIAILLLKYLQFKSLCEWATSNLIAFVRWNLFAHTDLWEWLKLSLKELKNVAKTDQLELTFGTASGKVEGAEK